jgi:acyl-CoA synthetase (AMP-forming)/AMP-acid ligase II
MLSGIPVEFQPSADAEAVLSSLARGRVTVLVGTMPSIHLIANDPDAAEYDLRALRLCALSNPICPVALRKEISTNLGAEAMTVNCIDEAGGSVTATQPGDTDEVLAATSGRTVAGVDLRIVNLESGRPVGMNEIGEVVVRSPMSSSGFLSDPEATAALRDDGGFVKTGELGALLSGDHLRLVGRTRDVIRRGGVTVDPADIEEVLKGCDGVGDAAVVGLPDEFLGELICACVVPSPGTASLKPPSLRVACALALSSVKIPDVVVPVDALPTLPDGRVSKSALRSILQGESSG